MERVAWGMDASSVSAASLSPKTGWRSATERRWGPPLCGIVGFNPARSAL